MTNFEVLACLLCWNNSALFQSLLFEACGRTVNPVSGAVGLLWSGNWHVCQAAVETVLAGGALRPFPDIFGGVLTPVLDKSSDTIYKSAYSSEFRPPFMHDFRVMNRKPDFDLSLFPEAYNNVILLAGASEMTSNDSCDGEKKRLLNLFVWEYINIRYIIYMYTKVEKKTAYPRLD